MPAHDPVLTPITFILAMLGYGGLGILFHLALRQRIPKFLLVSVITIIVVHVFMVWAFRYEWQFQLAVRNGYAGFVLFHAATLILILTTLSPLQWARRGLIAAFCIVSAGATGATLRYDEVSFYCIPVLVVLLAGVASAVHYLRSRTKTIST